MFLPPGNGADSSDENVWNSTYLNAVNTDFPEFMAAVEALSPGSIGVLDHVALSYYSGFTNITNSSGRIRAAPKYRATALVYPVTGYEAKQVMGSQRRRRTSSTP